MNALGRFLFGKPTPEPLSPSLAIPPLNGCPDCGAVEASIVCRYFGWRRGVEGPAFFEVGARLSCQRCPLIYSVGPLGTFRHHHRSLPPSFQLPDAPQSDDRAQRQPPPLRDPTPTPKARPLP